MLTKIDKLIDQRGLDAKKVEAMAGLPLTTITQWRRKAEEGKSVDPKMSQVIGLARTLGVSVDFLCDDSLDEPTPDPLTADEREKLKLTRLLTSDDVLDLIVTAAKAKKPIKPTTPQYKDEPKPGRRKSS